MKTNKFYTVLLVIAVASASMGMLTGMEGPFRLTDLGTRIHVIPEQKVAIFTPAPVNEGLRIEEWMYDLSSWAGLAEEEIVTEQWMTEPFETGSAPCTDPDTRVSFPFTMIDF